MRKEKDVVLCRVGDSGRVGGFPYFLPCVLDCWICDVSLVVMLLWDMAIGSAHKGQKIVL